jgi:hypothetical protein
MMKASEIMTPMRIDALDDNMSKVKKDTSGKKEDALALVDVGSRLL